MCSHCYPLINRVTVPVQHYPLPHAPVISVQSSRILFCFSHFGPCFRSAQTHNMLQHKNFLFTVNWQHTWQFTQLVSKQVRTHYKLKGDHIVFSLGTQLKAGVWPLISCRWSFPPGLFFFFVVVTQELSSLLKSIKQAMIILQYSLQLHVQKFPRNSQDLVSHFSCFFSQVHIYSRFLLVVSDLKRNGITDAQVQMAEMPVFH